MIVNRLRQAAAWYGRLPVIAAWALSLAALVLGLALLAPFGGPGSDAKAQSLQSDWSQTPWKFAALVLLVPILETLVFQTLFLDGFARLTRAR